ncbi:glutathione S-transferase 1-like [Eurosta solidaginis]|uniref:glutathione S-transferase 1-like n=1 Tax=Eurosta solidaginis TaxID=178769 RepID=UPI003530B488
MLCRHVNFAKKENQSDWFLKVNPNHTIPVLVDQGATLCDSHAIITYMTNQYGQNQHEHLYPKNFIQRAIVDERLYFNNGVLAVARKDFITCIVWGEEVAFNRKSIELAHKVYNFLESFLTRRSYVAGEYLTLADIAINAHLITLHKLVAVEEER